MKTVNLEDLKRAKPQTIICTLKGAFDYLSFKGVKNNSQNGMMLDLVVLVRNKMDMEPNDFYVILDEAVDIKKVIENNNKVIDNVGGLPTEFEEIFYNKLNEENNK